MFGTIFGHKLDNVSYYFPFLKGNIIVFYFHTTVFADGCILLYRSYRRSPNWRKEKTTLEKKYNQTHFIIINACFVNT